MSLNVVPRSFSPQWKGDFCQPTRASATSANGKALNAQASRLRRLASRTV